MRSYPEQEPRADVALHAAAVGQTDGQIRSGTAYEQIRRFYLSSGMLVVSGPSWWFFVTALVVQFSTCVTTKKKRVGQNSF